MKLARLAGLVGLAICAVCLVTASVSSAAIPTFSPSTKQNFLILSGTGILSVEGGTESIECASDHGSGLILNETLVDHVIVTFHGCVGKKGTTTCKAMTEGEPEGLITIDSLHGELGEVASAESKTGAGEYLVPESGKVFVEPLGSCLTEAPIEGEIAGEVTPTKKLALSGEVVFTGALGKQSIKKITTKTGGHTTSLSAFGIVGASENTLETIDYEKDVEVT